MTRNGPSRKVDKDYARGRLKNARAYLQAARDGIALLEEGANANPVMSQIVTAAVAFADTLTAERLNAVNQQNHAAVIKLLRDAYGRELPDSQARQLRQILRDKDEIQYGISFGTHADAEKMMQNLEAFATWAEEQLIGRL